MKNKCNKKGIQGGWGCFLDYPSNKYRVIRAYTPTHFIV